MDGWKILLDCGWNDAMDVELLAPLAKVAPFVDAVLVSHPDTTHLGALPYAFGKLNLRCKVYATLPVHKMGMMFMYDQFLARQNDGDFNLFTLDDVDAAFGAFVPVRYAQHSTLTRISEVPKSETSAAYTAAREVTVSTTRASLGAAEPPNSASSTPVCGTGTLNRTKEKPSSCITVTAYAAGHTLGGALWKVAKDAEDVIYAVDYNHRKEKHLNGTSLESFSRPSLLITDAFNARGAPPAKTRDADLMDVILRCVRRDGNVLVPIDPAGRALELMLLLEERWAKQQLGAYQLVLLTTVAYNTMEFARSHLEWMGENVGRNFDRDRLNAFNTRYLTLCHSVEELLALRPGPKVVLASFGSLEGGPSRRLFVEWATDPRNLIVLTDRAPPGTLSREVRELADTPPGARKPLQVSISRRVPLDGDALEVWRQKEAAKCTAREEEAAAAAKDVAANEPKIEHAGRVEEKLTPVHTAAIDARLQITGISAAGTRASDLHRRHCLVDGFLPPASAAAPMFGDETWAPEMTDFGESIDTDMFARAMLEASSSTPGAADAAIAQAEGPTAVVALAAVAAAADSDRSVAPPSHAPPPPPEEIPSEIVEETHEVHIRAIVHVCDYEGRADGRSVRTLITHVEPRRVILVHGTPQDTMHLRESLEASLPGVVVDAPSAGEAVDCTSDTAMYRLELSQELLARTRVRHVSGYQVGWVDGVVGFAPGGLNGEQVPVLFAPSGPTSANAPTSEEIFEAVASPNAKNDPVYAQGALDFISAAQENGFEMVVTDAAAAVAVAAAAAKERRRSAFVGDLKLSDFKLVLAAAGVVAEFSGGALVCAGGSVCVRKKAGSEDLVVEGALSDDFYRVREILFERFQIA